MTILLLLPFLHTVYWLGDEGILLNGAIRMLHGQILYKDFFEFLPPGDFILTATWLALVGKSLVSVRILTIILLSCLTCFIYLASYRASRFGFLSAALPIFWLLMSQGVWTELSHHWISLPLAMITIWATFAYLDDGERRSRWALIAGLAAGASGMATQTVGALTMLVALTVFADRRPDWHALRTYLAGCAAVPAALIIYLVLRGNFLAAIDDIIIFPFLHYSGIQRTPWGDGLNVQSWALALLYPLLLALAALDVTFHWRTRLHDRIYLAGLLYTLAGFALCFPRPDIGHLAMASPLAFPFVCILIARAWHRIGRVVQTSIKLLSAFIAITPLIAFGVIIFTAARQPSAPTPRGRVKFFNHPGIERLIKTIVASPKEQSYFFYPYEPMLYYLTDRMNIFDFDIFTPHYTTPRQYKETCLSVMHEATWIVISRSWTQARWKMAFPAIKNFRPPETVAFQNAINTGFRHVRQIGIYDLLHRTKSAMPTLCNDISE